MRCLVPIVAAIGLWAFAAGASPDLDPRAEGLDSMERLETLIQRVQEEQKQVKTLEARFVQRQESELLLEPEESTGVFSFSAPDRVRWEYTSPSPITMVIDGDEMTTWYRDLERAEQLTIGRYSNQVLQYLGASGSMGKLLEYFEVEAGFPKDPTQPYRLDLKPRYSRIAKRLRSMTIWIDPALFVPQRLRYEAGDGDVTEYRFESYRINASLPDDRFQVDLPDGVDLKVVDLGQS